MSEPLDGTSTKIVVLLNGVPAVLDDAISGFDDDVDLETRTRNPLGVARTKRNQILRGYSGTISMDDTNAGVQAFVRNYNALVDSGDPRVVTIQETTVRADTGQTTTRQWMRVTFTGFPRSMSGTANTTQRMAWSAEDLVTT